MLCEELKDRLLGVETRTDALKRSTPSPAFGGAFLLAAFGLATGAPHRHQHLSTFGRSRRLRCSPAGRPDPGSSGWVDVTKDLL